MTNTVTNLNAVKAVNDKKALVAHFQLNMGGSKQKPDPVVSFRKLTEKLQKQNTKFH